MNRHKIAQKIAVFFLRSGRGQGLIQKVIDPVKDILDGTVYLFALKGLFNISLPFYALIGIVAVKKCTEVIIGYADEHWGFWKAENYYSSYELSPYNKELMDRVKRIEEKCV